MKFYNFIDELTWRAEGDGISRGEERQKIRGQKRRHGVAAWLLHVVG